jgi:hypothetical protein
MLCHNHRGDTGNACGEGRHQQILAMVRVDNLISARSIRYYEARHLRPIAEAPHLQVDMWESVFAAALFEQSARSTRYRYIVTAPQKPSCYVRQIAFGAGPPGHPAPDL